MERFTDWNCQLLPNTHDAENSAQAVAQALTDLYDRYGLSRFCMMRSYHHRKEPVSVFLLRQNAPIESLSPLLPREMRLKVSSQTLLLPKLHEVDGLEDLKTAKDGYLPISMPLGSYEDWMDEEINRLLYVRRSPLLFTSVERYAIFYPPEILQKLLGIDGAVYQFGYKSLVDPSVRKLISQLLSRRATVLLGTSLNHAKKVSLYTMDHYLQIAAQAFSALEYQRLLYYSHSFWD